MIFKVLPNPSRSVINYFVVEGEKKRISSVSCSLFKNKPPLPCSLPAADLTLSLIHACPNSQEDAKTGRLMGTIQLLHGASPGTPSHLPEPGAAGCLGWHSAGL